MTKRFIFWNFKNAFMGLPIIPVIAKAGIKSAATTAVLVFFVRVFQTSRKIEEPFPPLK